MHLGSNFWGRGVRRDDDLAEIAAASALAQRPGRRAHRPGTVLLSLDPGGFSAAGIELQLEVYRAGSLLLPLGRFSIDGGAPLNVLAPPGEGGLDPEQADFFAGALVVTSPLPEPGGFWLIAIALAAAARWRKAATFDG